MSTANVVTGRAEFALQAAALAIVALLASIDVLSETLTKKEVSTQKSRIMPEQTTLFTAPVLFMTFMWVSVIVSHPKMLRKDSPNASLSVCIDVAICC